jgi:hypothetical protein
MLSISLIIDSGSPTDISLRTHHHNSLCIWYVIVAMNMFANPFIQQSVLVPAKNKHCWYLCYVRPLPIDSIASVAAYTSFYFRDRVAVCAA